MLLYQGARRGIVVSSVSGVVVIVIIVISVLGLLGERSMWEMCCFSAFIFLPLVSFLSSTGLRLH